MGWEPEPARSAEQLHEASVPSNADLSDADGTSVPHKADVDIASQACLQRAAVLRGYPEWDEQCEEFAALLANPCSSGQPLSQASSESDHNESTGAIQELVLR